MLFSVIIPAFNEEKRLNKTLEKIVNYFNRQVLFEIIIVNDGSSDNTSKFAKEFLQKKNVKFQILDNLVNKGKGYSVRKGMLCAKGEYCLFMDADSSTDISELTKMKSFLHAEKDILIGSRRVKSSDSEVIQRIDRMLIGRLANLLIRKTLKIDHKDTQCGFKVFSKRAKEEIFSRQALNGWGFDFEILFLARLYGYEVIEIPVNWIYSGDSRLKVGSAIYSALKELFAVRSNYYQGKYKKK